MYIKNYENMTNLFESLKLDENLNSSVKDAGGIDSDQVKNLVEKYLTSLFFTVWIFLFWLT